MKSPILLDGIRPPRPSVAAEPVLARSRDTKSPGLKVEINMMPKERVNVQEALKMMLPHINEYLRLGAYADAGAVVDQQFETTDVLIVLPISAIDTRYFLHFGEPNEVLPHTGSRGQSPPSNWEAHR